MLGLYEEALVQYDELDALFSQFVLNSNVAESPKWLDTFRQPITSWQAVRLTALIPQHLRELIIKKKASLLDFRSYLYQRQSAMLLLMYKPWEVSFIKLLLCRCHIVINFQKNSLNISLLVLIMLQS